jgi:four helix bundle protein
VHKLSIALKELRESRFSIRLIVRAGLLKNAKMAGVVDEVEQLCNIVGWSLVTTRRNLAAAKARNRRAS